MRISRKMRFIEKFPGLRACQFHGLPFDVPLCGNGEANTVECRKYKWT